MNVRAATPDDYAPLLPFFLGLRSFSRAGHPDPVGDVEDLLTASRDYLRDILARGSEGRTFVVDGDDRGIAGYLVATIHPPNLLTSSGAVVSGSIDELFVGEEWRGAGVAGALLDASEAWMRENGAVHVSVGAYAWNADAIAFYERHGFGTWTVSLTKPL